MSLATIPYNAFEMSTERTPSWRAWRGRVRSAMPWLRRFAIAGAALACVYLAAMAAIMVTGYRSVPRGADVMLVLGTTVRPSGNPSERLRARLNKAIELYNAGFARTVIVSGATGEEGVNEAEAMRRFLMERGLPEAAIVADTTGIDTYTSAQHTAQYLKEHGLRSVLVVSQFYHVPRAELALHNFGVAEVSRARAYRFGWRTDIRGLAREVPGLLYYSLRPYPAV